MVFSPEIQNDVFEYLLRLGDDRLVLGHRLSEWCGHGPILEEDIAISNLALDCVGQAIQFLKLAGEVEGKGRSEDDIAYFRDVTEYRNLMMLELPKGDFGFTIARQFFFDVYSFHLMGSLQESNYEELAAIAAKSLKEIRYHLRHSSQWVLRLGDGTEESHQRIQDAVDDLWMYTGEMFEVDDVMQRLIDAKTIPPMPSLKTRWKEMVVDILNQATLQIPTDTYMVSGSRQGRHTEHLGFILADMQFLPRAYPDGKW